MNQPSDRIQAYLASALAGSLVGQLAQRRDLSFEDLVADDNARLNVLRDEITELGVDPRLLANHALCALVAVFVEESNAELVIQNLTNLLWSILGDPEHGGSPPEIYRRAGLAMHLTLIGLIDPAVLDHALRD